MMPIRRAQSEKIEPVLILRNADNTPATGQTAWYAVQRADNGQWWHSALGWQTATWATVVATAAYHNTYSDQGNGAYIGATWDQAANDGAAARTYVVSSYVSSPGDFEGAVAHEEWVFKTEESDLIDTPNMVALAAIANAMANEEYMSAGVAEDSFRAAMKAAAVQGSGTWKILGTQLALYTPGGSEYCRFDLDSITSPTERVRV